MKTYSIPVSILFFISTKVFAIDKDVYYVGQEIRTSLFGKPQVVEPILLKRSELPSKKMIIEIACVKKENGSTLLSPAFMSVTGNDVIISDKEVGPSKFLSGTGKLEGPEWAWNYLNFSMSYKIPKGTLRIDDENWISGKHLVAIKEVFYKESETSPEIKTDIITAKLRELSLEEYQTQFKEMGCL